MLGSCQDLQSASATAEWLSLLATTSAVTPVAHYSCMFALTHSKARGGAASNAVMWKVTVCVRFAALVRLQVGNRDKLGSSMQRTTTWMMALPAITKSSLNCHD